MSASNPRRWPLPIHLAALGGLVLGLVLGAGRELAGEAEAAPGASLDRAESRERLHRPPNERHRVSRESRIPRHREGELDPLVAFEQAKALGIPETISDTRPSLRPELVRRMSIALVREARRHGLDPLLLTAVARVESTFNPWAVSHAGAVGLLQVKAMTGREVMQRHQGAAMLSEAELFDIETNVALGAAYLAQLLERFGSLEMALLAYNRGPTGARQAVSGPDAPRMMAGYPRRVIRAFESLAQSPEADVPGPDGACSAEDACKGES